jgi:hypothetical protein
VVGLVSLGRRAIRQAAVDYVRGGGEALTVAREHWRAGDVGAFDDIEDPERSTWW